MLSVTTKRGIRRGVVSSRHTSVAAVWSPAWQGRPRVTRLWGQIPGGLIQTALMIIPYPGLMASGHTSLQSPPSFLQEEQTRAQKLHGANSGLREGVFPFGDPQGALDAECPPLSSSGALLLSLDQLLCPRHTQKPSTKRLPLPPLSDASELSLQPPQATR